MQRYLAAFTAAILTPTQLGLPQANGGLDGAVGAVVNTVFGVIGAVSVLFIVIGGFKYIVSGGDSAGVKSAKETITYAVIGLVIALLAFGIVNFITSSVGKAS